MLRRRRPNVPRLAARGDAKRLVRALGYHDQLSDSYGRLYDLGAGVRRDAALALTSVADTGEVNIGVALIGALGDSSGEVRRAAASALGARREGLAAGALVQAALTWRNPRYEDARLAAVEALTDLSGPEIAEQLVRVFIERQTDPERARELVARMLDNGGEDTACSACATAAAALSTEDGVRAERAAEVLSWLGPIAVEPLLDGLDGTQARRIPAIRALARLGDLRAGDAFVRLLSDGDVEVRAAAAAALGEIADPACGPALAAATHDAHHLVRTAALQAIRRLGPLASPLAPTGGVARPADELTRRSARAHG